MISQRPTIDKCILYGATPFDISDDYTSVPGFLPAVLCTAGAQTAGFDR